MKHLFLLSLLAISAIKASAQVTSLSENFNSNCAVLGENYPNYWSEYDIYSNPVIAWTCGPSDGRGTSEGTTSPGIQCHNDDGFTTYTDTAWLFTPQLNLSFYSGGIYLQFDTKFLNDAARLSILVSNSYQAGWPPDTLLAEQTWSDLTSGVSPDLGNTGSATWTTHSVDLTPYKSAPLYVAFRYTSSSTGSSTWIIDNVSTTQTPVNRVSIIEKNALSLNVVGAAPGKIVLSYSVPVAATYRLAVYDMVGRVVHKETLNVQEGTTTHTIDDLDLQEGMYLVKMDNGITHTTAKAIVR